MAERPWWWPTEANEAWAKNFRKRYGVSGEIPLKRLKDNANQGRGWVVTWDHSDNAYEEYKKMAEMLVKMENALKIIRADIRYLVEEGTLPANVVTTHPSITGLDQLLKECAGTTE